MSERDIRRVLDNMMPIYAAPVDDELVETVRKRQDEYKAALRKELVEFFEEHLGVVGYCYIDVSSEEEYRTELEDASQHLASKVLDEFDVRRR